MAFRVKRTDIGVFITKPRTTDTVHIKAEDLPLLIAELQHMWEHHRIYTDMGQVGANDSGVIGKPDV